MDDFIMVPTPLMRSKIPRSAMLLLGILNCNARLLDCSIKTINNLLKYLTDNNYITIINGNNFKRRRSYVRNKVLIT